MAVQVLGKVAYFNKGAYNSQTNYEINDVVSYNGSSYVSLNDNNQGNLPTNTNYWSVVAEKGDKGDTGKPFVIEKTYSTIESMVADYNNMNVNDYVMIQGSIEEQENATLWTKREVEVSPYKWAYLADFSGASGITGATPNIHIGTVTEGNEPSVTRRSGSSNENPILDFVLKTGAKGDTGATGNGISSFEKTSTSGLVDTYTITFTNGTSTTIEVTNGRGIVSITKTSSVDYVDTYTITYNDGTTSTFEVANSEVTEEEFNDVVDELNYLYDDLPKVEGEGTSLTLDNTRKGKISNALKGNEISQFTTTGKNLLKVASSTFINRNVTTTYNFETGVLSSTGVANSGWPWIVESVLDTPIPAGTQVTFSVDNVQNYEVAIRFQKSETAYDDSTSILPGNLSATKTLTTDCVKIIVLVYYGTGTTADTNMRLQLEVGSTPTEFELYTGGNPAPNPDYPQDVHVVSGDNDVEICGKNLFDKDNANVINAYISLGNSKITYSNGDNCIYIPIKNNTTYTVSKILSNRFIVGCTDVLPASAIVCNPISTSQSSNTSYTITSGNDSKYLVVYCYTSNDTLTLQEILDTIQIEKSSTASTYQPYEESQTYPINLGTMELCKIGDYQDYIYKDNGKWYKYSEIGKQILDGSETYDPSSTNTTGKYRIAYKDISNIILAPPNVSTKGNILCDYFEAKTANQTYQCQQGISVSTNGDIQIYNLNNEIGSVNAFKTWLSTNNTSIYYVLATPNNTEITDQTLISQLDNFEKALSYNTQTNISQENNDLPFIISASAFMSLKYIFGNLETRVAELEG